MPHFLADYQFGWVSGVMLLATLVALFTAAVLWPYRYSAAAKFLALLEVAVAVWSFALIFESAATTVSGKLFWSQIQYIGTATAPTFYFLFTITYAGQQQFLTRRNLALLAGVPLLTLLLAFTNPLHRWLWSDIVLLTDGNGLATYQAGVYWWFFVAYTYALLFAGFLALCLSVWRFPGHYQSQITLLIIGSALPMAANVMYVLGMNPIPALDLSPIAFTLTGAILSWAIFRHQLFDLLPIARSRLVDKMASGVLVLDIRQRVVDINPAMAHLLDADAGAIVGQPANLLLAGWADFTNLLHADDDIVTELTLGLADDRRCFEVRVSPLRRRNGQLLGRLVVLYDISVSKQLADEREQLITELQDALAHIKTLRGLLPICANCKRIRDDDGQWQRVEEYVREHSEADFSHGICPDCMGELYGDFLSAKK
ncbi:MAG: hypothetical protein Kow0031_21190 [Anaerolineae bacterium]